MHFTDLRIYQIAIQLVKEIKELVYKIPHYWTIPESSQILESSSSVSSNIAEGFAKRIYPKEFIRFLEMSPGSSDESQNHLISLNKKGHISKEPFDHYFKRYKDLSIRILNTIRVIH